MNYIPRRLFLKDVLGTSAALMAGAIFPINGWAEWPTSAFEAKTLEEVFSSLFVVESTKIAIKVPDPVENGAIVPLDIEANLPNVESITILAEQNPIPLIAQFQFPNPDQSIGWVRTRIKMSTSSEVAVLVKSKGQLYLARQKVNVINSGCGA